jgi:Uma2 family endonuclease
MASGTTRAKVDDLDRSEGKAELIGGRVVEFMSSGYRPHRVAFNIAMSLRAHEMRTGQGVAGADNLGYIVPELPSGRESFSPDASYYTGPLPTNPMRFMNGPPTFAVEVRSEHDYGPSADAEYADKRADYFAAGTLVVWDVDPIAQTVTCYRVNEPEITWRGNDTAHAKPAVPGWSIALEEVFA